ncbi:pyrroloquinoline-quinone synthase [Amycolatopsis bartoniae]|uniref:Pyrroloquinoline-quinone synthase n=1 Tax=Amycolatopsis bartoniae TaxID=941986 RepID=A0A8H9IP77_9PSEU|nr:pyrroloquinoline-quinone synthase PqqC [Amycolatopsis bartoniae]MBB2937961.1 pyrroloquinoline-quinone synthase [Amycolatopsis bartoniae]TVT08551.1 pyrroloquinoline-quinone synthase PqqC [Amycolatopsis bartoniae]GHF41982.1 pyrroloquinoline-quinone synthase [Amycolatopsis bartoniae]
MAGPLSRAELTDALLGLEKRYWAHHPFHLRLHEGGCEPADLRRWVANRWYYQKCLPQKNAAIVAACPLPEVRRGWLERISFHDGEREGEGGMAQWLRLAEAVGLSTAEVLDERHVLPGVRFAVDGYLDFCRTRPWIEGVAAALTELFSPGHMTDRVNAWRKHYGWIEPAGFAYFDRRIPAARQDSAFTLKLVLDHCTTRAEQDAAIRALSFKCDVLWAVLDAVDYARRA